MKFDMILASMLIIFETFARSKSPIVNTLSGVIEGTWKESRLGRPYQEYLGIPYALPPIGELRFEPPAPVAPWSGVLSAKIGASECLQYTQEMAKSPSHVRGKEDCLYLNVFASVPYEKDDAALLPVIIFIFGGGFQLGDALEWGPKHLMDKDLICVSFNYRLGPFGYLSTEDGVVPGNMGLKDQSFAIKWVSENINSFGGDPGKVTLAGLSSGAASVHFQYLSPMNRGLFHQLIVSSGTTFNCWAQAEGSLEKAKKLGMLMGCPTYDNHQMIQCLKSFRGESIAMRIQDMMPWRYNPAVVFGPVVEKHSLHPFIDKPPIDIIESEESIDLPWLLSADSEEGLYPASDFTFYPKRMKYIDDNWDSIAPYILDYNYTIPLSDHAIVARKIKQFYMGNKSIEFSNAADFVRMVGDRLFAVENGKFTKKLAMLNNKPIWFYKFAYRGEYSISEVFGGTNANVGVGHGDERYLIFSIRGCDLHNETDIEMSKDMVNLWYTFATTGIPDMGVEWPPVERWSDNLNYLRISAPGQLKMEDDDNFGEKTFWSTIDFDENKRSSD